LKAVSNSVDSRLGKRLEVFQWGNCSVMLIAF
jgi:hypothetical protein